VAQNIGNPARGTSGHMLGQGLNGVGQLCHLFGPGDPNTIADGNDSNPGVVSACVGSLYSRLDAPSNVTALYVKTSLPNVWTAK